MTAPTKETRPRIAGAGLLGVPGYRSVDQLTGQHWPSAFFSALDEASAKAADAELIRETFTRSIGFYDCPCGSEFEFTEHDGIEAYGALNRWLGQHVSGGDRCPL